MAVAIDGPSGAGKSTISRILAKELGFVYVDTGALYRAVGYYMLSNNIDPKDADTVVAALTDLTLEMRYVGGEQQVLVNGADVGGYIRTPEVSMAASAVSALPPVRQFLLDTQRRIAATENVIMDGRDIGTVVLPQAELKIFLTATAEDRAQRRFAELQEKGIATTFEEVLADMQKRDYDDSHRAAAPLKQADDARLVDTTGFTLEQSVATLKGLVEEMMA
ncbi:MAG: (d)CMP kinase [Ruminococcaceae bacterium]|nr:(d)CMP kinase [Oscillospiraceae bacterium]